VLLEIGERGIRQLPRRVLADGFKHRDDVDRLPLEHAWQDGAAIDEHRGTVEPRHGDYACRHVLVAAADCHESVEAFRPITVSIESAITSRDTSEYFMPSVPIEIASETVMVLKITGLAPAFRHAVGGMACQRIDVHVARRHLAPRRADADLRFREVGSCEADGVQHCAPRCPLWAV
jgi:hypothetical protein